MEKEKVITRKIFFYKIFCRLRKNAVNVFDIFQFINKLKYEKSVAGRYLQLKEKDLSVKIDLLEKDIIKAKIGTTRHTGLPQLEKNGIEESLKIPADMGIYDPTHFIVFDNKYIGFEFNYYGPRPGGLKYYIKKKANNIVNYVDISPLKTNNLFESIKPTDRIKSFNFKFCNDIVSKIKHVDDDLYEVVNRMCSSKYDTIEVVLNKSLSPKKSDSLVLPFLFKISSWFKKDAKAIESIKKMNIETFECYDDVKISKEIDLLSEYIYTEESVVKEDDESRGVSTEAMYDKIIEAYNKLKSKITA